MEMRHENAKLTALKAHQGQTKDAAAKVERIREAIAAQESELAQCKELETRLAELTHRREDLTAGLALGESNQTDLDKVNKEIEGICSQMVPFDSIQETIAGLQRKLDQAENEYRDHKNKAHYAFRDLLLAEAEEVGAEYLATAKQLVRLYRRALALDSFLKPLGYPVSHGLGVETQLRIPTLMLECHKGSEAGGLTYLLGDAQDVSSHYGTLAGQDIEAERQRLAGLGIDLD
jgi:hypothetical protein